MYSAETFANVSYFGLSSGLEGGLWEENYIYRVMSWLVLRKVTQNSTLSVLGEDFRKEVTCLNC